MNGSENIMEKNFLGLVLKIKMNVKIKSIEFSNADISIVGLPTSHIIGLNNAVKIAKGATLKAQ